MGNTPVLETERLVLRRFTENDAEAILELFSDEEVCTYLPMFPLRSLEEAKQWLEDKFLKRYRAQEGYHYAVCWKADGRLLGYVDVGAEDSFELGYALRKDIWGQGVATEACLAILEQMQGDGVPFVTATHDARNLRSGEVLKRAGLTYRYSYMEQWQPKDIEVTFRMYQRNLDGWESRIFRGYWEKHAIHFVEAML